MPFTVTIFTLFPELFPGPLGHSLVGKALDEGKWNLNIVNIRDFSKDKHQTVDDTPYGGGAGMVMRPDVVAEAIDSVLNKPLPPGEAGLLGERSEPRKPGEGNLRHVPHPNPLPGGGGTPHMKLYYMSPRGAPLTQQKTTEIQQHDHIGILCARYEGVDQRVIDAYGMEELSIGDYVLSNGEIAAYCVIDACVRQRTSVLGNPLTLVEESFSAGRYANLLEYPLFTRPSEWRGMAVPEVLTSGNHQAIDAWRFEQAEAITRERRKDLWKKHKSEITS